MGQRSRPKVTFTFTFSRRFYPKRRTRERTIKLRTIEPGVTINTTLHKKSKKDIERKRGGKKSVTE